MRSKFVSVLLLLALIISALVPATQARADSPVQTGDVDSESASPDGMLNPDGTLNVDGAFNGSLNLEGYNVTMDSKLGPVFSSDTGILTPGIGHNVFAIAISGSNIYVGGDFQDVDGIPEADFIAKWNGSAWSALGHNGAGNGSLNDGVRAIAVSGVNVYVGGNFTNVSNYGTTMNDADYLALWEGNNWFHVGHNGAGNGSLNSSVAALAIDGTNLYVGGHFTNVNNYGTALGAADYIAKFNGTDWSSLGSNGAGNGSLNAVASAITINGSNIYVGGSFTNVNNNGTVLGAADIIARWNGSNWSALGNNGAGDGSLNAGNGSSGWIAAITLVGTDIYVGGSFLNVNNKGTVIPSADFIARWDGSDWHSLGSDGSSNGAIQGQVYSIVVSGLALYVGGNFQDVNSNGTVISDADYIARWNGVGWSGVGTNGSGNGPIQSSVYAMAVSGSDLYAVGTFTTVVINNMPLIGSGHIAKWNNSTWSALISASTPPQVLSIDRVTASPANTASVNFTVIFSKPVTGVDAFAPFSDFSLTTTGVSGAAVSGVSGTSSFYVVTVNTGSGDGTIRLNVVDDNSIVDATSNPLGGAALGDGNFTTGEVYTINKSSIFVDVPLDYSVKSYIERLYNAGITGGCSLTPLMYCPDNTVTRAQMAVFLLRGIHGSGYTPPAVGASTGFADVPTNHPVAAWIKQLAAEGITGGCSNGNYCPDATVTRAQMAVFLLRSKYTSAYTPPPANGDFTDVPLNHLMAAWIEQLAAEGITGGCGAGVYCPDGNVTRAQMAVFLVRTFNLP